MSSPFYNPLRVNEIVPGGSLFPVKEAPGSDAASYFPMGGEGRRDGSDSFDFRLSGWRIESCLSRPRAVAAGS